MNTFRLNKIIALFAALTFGTVCAQAIEPVLTDHKVWLTENYYTFGAPDLLPQMKYEVAGDTIVAGRECKIIKVTGYNIDTPEQRFAWCEEDGKVYCHDFSGHGTFDLMYDLAASKGDAVGKIKSVVDSFKLTLCGTERQAVKVYWGAVENCDNVIEHDYWIEGIGPVNGALAADQVRITSGNRYFGGMRVIKCYDADRLIFERKEFNSEIDKHTASIETVTTDAVDSSQLYDLSGRRVARPESGHIYVSKGKKILWRQD